MNILINKEYYGVPIHCYVSLDSSINNIYNYHFINSNDITNINKSSLNLRYYKCMI